MSRQAQAFATLLTIWAAAPIRAQAPAPKPAPTETPVRFEASFYGAYTRFDHAFQLKGTAGGGVRIGYLITPTFELELDALFEAPQTPAGYPSEVSPLFGGGSLIVNLPAGDRLTFYGLAGYSREDFGGSAPYHFTDGGPHAGAGARMFLGSDLALRAEARELFAPQTNAPFGPSWAGHFVASLGLSVFRTGAPVRLKDSDGDGVPDKRDKCANTPLGATVDLNGCPSDSDRDGVYDGLDKCPNTPLGAVVDPAGCPVDSDKDGVPDGVDKCPNTPAGAAVDAQGCPHDSDGDGVLDGLDKCPNTPRGALVDPTGCPIDSDKDGVADGIDRCPNTPAGAVVDALGCPVDSDHDGVPDGIDKCPGTPPGTRVDAAGCPVQTLDSDGDGVPDALDKCPNTPRGTPVDAKGCSILFVTPPAPAAGAAPRRPTYVLRGVNFQTGRSLLTPTSYATLDQVAEVLLANPDIRIEIAGYTDNTGSRAINVRLSLARALAVRAYLARKGVAPARMTAQGFGPANPVAPNVTAAGRAQNRRVELHKLP